jgi:hypothetical protein
MAVARANVELLVVARANGELLASSSLVWLYDAGRSRLDSKWVAMILV